MSKLAIFDCDSTLSSIEGIDELARLKGREILDQVADLTNQAMDGKVPLDQVFGKRIDIIRPNRDDCEIVANLYMQTIDEDAASLISDLKSEGWTPVILSGGFRELILPLAEKLGITSVEAVPLHLDEDGNYGDFDRSYPTTRNGGKPEIIANLRQKHSPQRLIMIGDGISDLECQDHVDAFIGFGKYANRQLVRQGAQHFVTELKQVFRIAQAI